MFDEFKQKLICYRTLNNMTTFKKYVDSLDELHDYHIEKLLSNGEFSYLTNLYNTNPRLFVRINIFYLLYVADFIGDDDFIDNILINNIDKLAYIRFHRFMRYSPILVEYILRSIIEYKYYLES